MASESMRSLRDYEDYAEKYMNSNTWAFYSQGAERENTMKDNVEAFTRYRLIPKMLNNAVERDLSTTVLGGKVSLPIGIAPTAFQKLAHPDGEMATAKAAADMGTIFSLSTCSNTPLEDISKNVPTGSLLWMQIYVMKNREVTEKMIKKAEASGFKALVLTVDTPVVGLQLRLPRNQLLLPPHLKVPNVEEAVAKTGMTCDPSRQTFRVSDVFSQTLSWDDVAWIKSLSKLPLIIKGIMTAEDATLAAKNGASAVWVSNHGGRQLDGIDASLDALPAISAALAETQCEVYMDGGIRWGSDVLKALALGAKFVFIGRPALWGLAHSGEDGVRCVLKILKDELDKTMHLAGCRDVKDIGSNLVRKEQTAKL